MALRDTLLTAYTSWPNRETVTLRSRTTHLDSYYTIENAQRRVLTARELAASYGRYTSTDLNWLIPVTMIPADVTPKMFDQVIDSAGQHWTIQSPSLECLQTYYKLTSRDMVIAYDLRQTGTFQRATYTTSAGGGRVPTWANITGAINVKCRLQPMTGEVYEELAKRGERIRYTLFVEEWPSITVNDRLVLGGNTYSIQTWRNQERLDVLPEIDVSLEP